MEERQFIQAKNIPISRASQIYVTIDNVSRVAAEISTFDAVVTKEKDEIKVVGDLGSQSRYTGFKCTGKMSFFPVTSVWNMLADKLVNEGIDTYFEFRVYCEDPQVDIGTQEIAFYSCNLDDISIVKISNSETISTLDSSFTFHRFKLLQTFTDTELVSG